MEHTATILAEIVKEAYITQEANRRISEQRRKRKSQFEFLTHDQILNFEHFGFEVESLHSNIFEQKNAPTPADVKPYLALCVLSLRRWNGILEL